MKNGEYILIKAPDNYPGKLYREKYCYEHQYVWWLNTGEILSDNETIHHKNKNKHDNSFSNLEKITRNNHTKLHAKDCPMTEYICEYCKRNFYFRTSGPKRRFCSRRCNGYFNHRKHSSMV